jgi:hypothetical protein
MRLMIDRSGAHEAPELGERPCHMVVDGSGCLVDLSAVSGPLQDPDVIKLDWGPILQFGREAGRIFRKPPGFPIAQVQVFTDKATLKPYLRAFQKRMAKIEADTAAHLEAEAARAAAAQEAAEAAEA